MGKREPLKIVNIIHIGDKAVNWEDLSQEERYKVAVMLNAQALRSVGYRPVEEGN